METLKRSKDWSQNSKESISLTSFWSNYKHVSQSGNDCNRRNYPLPTTYLVGGNPSPKKKNIPYAIFRANLSTQNAGPAKQLSLQKANNKKEKTLQNSHLIIGVRHGRWSSLCLRLIANSTRVRAWPMDRSHYPSTFFSAVLGCPWKLVIR